jgi:hypothetical protein
MAIRKTTVLAWMPNLELYNGRIYATKYADFGIVVPAGVTPVNWNPAASSPLPLALDIDHPNAFSDWRGHPNLFVRNVWDPTNWPEPDGKSFFGWRFENRDENLDRWLAVTFEWNEIGGPDMALGAVSGGNEGTRNQRMIIGVEPPNGQATIQFRDRTENHYSDAHPVVVVENVGTSRWQIRRRGDAQAYIVGRITAPHLAPPFTEVVAHAQDWAPPIDLSGG